MDISSEELKAERISTFRAAIEACHASEGVVLGLIARLLPTAAPHVIPVTGRTTASGSTRDGWKLTWSFPEPGPQHELLVSVTVDSSGRVLDDPALLVARRDEDGRERRLVDAHHFTEAFAHVHGARWEQFISASLDDWREAAG